MAGDKDLSAATRRIVDDAIEQLRAEPELSPVTRGLAQTVLRGLKRRGDYDDVIRDLDRITADLGRTHEILTRCTAALREEEERVAVRSPGSVVWWNTRRRAVVRALKKDRSDDALRLWAGVWAEGLAAGEWARCQELLALLAVPTAWTGIKLRLRAVTDALATGRHAEALDPLDELLGTGTERLEPGTAVRLAVLRTRILAGEFSDREVIGTAADTAVALAGDGPWRSLALAALAETQVDAGEPRAAHLTLQQADRTGEGTIDVLVARGLLHEADQLWASADQRYDEAVAIDRTAAVRPDLLRPVPARLLVRAAVSADLPTTEAVDLLRRALDQGSRDDAWTREVRLALAGKLEQLADAADRARDAEDHRSEAAQLLARAAKGFSVSGLTGRGIELFQRACELAPDVADIRWAYAEALRLDACHRDNTVDLDVLRKARTHLEHGLGLRRPAQNEGWVLLTQALVEEDLPDSAHEPVVLLERALLKDPSSATGYGFLAQVLRRRGFVQEAYEASDDGRENADLTDPFLFDAHFGALMDLGRYDEALDVVERQTLLRPDDDVASYRAQIALHLGRPDDALAELAAGKPTDELRLLRAYCLDAAGDVAAAREGYRSLWIDTRSGPTADIAGWAAYGCGLVEEAIQIYRPLRERAPVRTAYARDLGQMLLVHGDVAEGRGLLQEGIGDCPFVADLRLMADVEFKHIRRATAEKGHGAEVAAVLTELRERSERRCEELLRRRHPAGSAPALLGAARLAMHAGRLLDALASYEKLVGDNVPEAGAAAAAAVASARADADALFVGGSHDEARDQWSDAERALVRITGDEYPDLLLSLTCRRMLTTLLDGSSLEVAAWLHRESEDRALEPALAETAQTLGHDPDTLWALRDGLLEVARHPGVGGQARRLARSAVDRLPFARAYRLDAADAADALGSRVLLVNPLELRLGPAVDELRDAADLKAAIKDLQDRLEAEAGVRIPWVHPVAAPRLPGHQVDVRVYGSRVGSTVLDGDRDTWVAQAMAELEERVRGYLFRLVGVDDVALWREGWDLGSGDPPAWDPVDPQADRLRLARVLRMLLREQVPVGDRHAIVDAVRAHAASDEYGTLGTLLEVRRRLGPAALGLGPETSTAPLPAALEARVGAGLPPERPVWELPRPEALRLVKDLRVWLRDLPEWPGVVTVADARVRPFVWRLLAAERPKVCVLAYEELGPEGRRT